VVRPDDQVVLAALKTVCGMDFQMGMSASMLPPALQGRSARPPVSESESMEVPLSVPPLPFPLHDMKRSAAAFRFAPSSRRALVLVGQSPALKGTGQSCAEIRVESMLTSTQRSASGVDVVPLASRAGISSSTEPLDVSQSASLQTSSIASFTLEAATLQELESDEAARWVFSSAIKLHYRIALFCPSSFQSVTIYLPSMCHPHRRLQRWLAVPEFDSLYSHFQHDARTLIRKHASNELFNAYVAHRQGHSLSASSAPALSTLASTSLPLSSPLVRLRVAKPERVRLRIGTAMSAFDAARADERSRRAESNSGSSTTSGVVRGHRIARGVHLRAKCRPITTCIIFRSYFWSFSQTYSISIRQLSCVRGWRPRCPPHRMMPHPHLPRPTYSTVPKHCQRLRRLLKLFQRNALD
jgi:hypothetical protein